MSQVACTGSISEADLCRYLINPKPVVENASTEELNHAAPYSTADDDAEGSSARKPDARDARDARDGRDNKRRKMDKKEKTGQNKARHFPVLQESGVKICRSWETTGTCSKGPACRFQHDWAQYFQLKPFDIHYELNPTILTTPADGSANGGYVVLGSPEVGGEDYVGKTIDVKTSCPVFEDLGYCPYGWRCRFLGGHSTRVAEGAEKVQPAEGDWQLKGSQIGRQAPTGRWKVKETNFPNTQLLQSLKFSEVATSSLKCVSIADSWLPVPVPLFRPISQARRAPEGVYSRQKAAQEEQGRQRGGRDQRRRSGTERLDGDRDQGRR